jgi:hypothetical protein
MPFTTGATPKNAPIASRKPRMPEEKLSTSISKPARTFPAQILSTCLRINAERGPTIIAPRNMGVPAAPMTTPIVTTAPMTPPRVSYTIRPPV